MNQLFLIHNTIKLLANTDQNCAYPNVKMIQYIYKQIRCKYIPEGKYASSERIAIAGRTEGCRAGIPRYGQQYQGWFEVCAQPMRDGVNL